MNRESHLYKGALLKEFVQLFKHVPHRLRSCLHSFDEEHPNDFHLEDDVWSHTMLVYMFANIDDVKEDWLKDSILMACLCHDYGKIETRASHKYGRINMWNHGEAGIQFAVLATYEMFHEKYDHSTLEKMIGIVSFAVSNHVMAYDVKLHNYANFVNHDYATLKVLVELLEADYHGQITIKSDHVVKDIELIDNLRTLDLGDSNDVKECDIWIYGGIPGSGKDTSAGFVPLTILSFDIIRMMIYNQKVPDGSIGKSNTELYEAAFQYCRINKIGIGNFLKIELKKAKEAGLKVAVCNVNHTRKARKSIINMIREVYGKDVNIGCNYVLTTLKASLDNDVNRPLDKTVGKEVICKFSSTQAIPNMSEGFAQVNIEFNKYGVRSGR